MTDLHIIDIAIVLVLAMGAILGFKQGAIKSLAKLIGTFGAIVLAFYLKNPLSVFMYNNLPVFEFKGYLSGISVLNILLYEAIAYLIVFFILLAIFRMIIKLTGIIEKLLKLTIVLGLASKIVGIFIGLAHAFLFVFIVLFVADKYMLFNDITIESKYPEIILKESPILSSMIGDTQSTVDEIIGLKDMFNLVYIHL